MRKINLILLALMLISACKTQQIIPPNEVAVKSTSLDSVSVKDSMWIEDNVRIDTVVFYIPAQEKETVQIDSSHLETDFATSDARIRADGSLFHSLKNKPQEVKKEHKYNERTIHNTKERHESSADSTEVPLKVYVDVPVKVPLRWWEKMFMIIGIAACIGVGMYLFFKFKGV